MLYSYTPSLSYFHMQVASRDYSAADIQANGYIHSKLQADLEGKGTADSAGKVIIPHSAGCWCGAADGNT